MMIIRVEYGVNLSIKYRRGNEFLEFWSRIWLVKRRYNEDVSWLEEVTDRIGSVEK